MSLRESVARRVREMPPARRLRFQLATEALERFAGGNALALLDAGCGEGLLTTTLARRHRDWSLTGVDLSPPLIESARREARRLALSNVEFRTGDVTGDLGERRYDAVAALECLEEIRDDRAAVGAISLALRPGGLLVAHVPARDWAPVLPGSDRTWRHEVRHGYGAQEIAELLENAGLNVVSVAATTRGTVHLAQELRDRIKRSSLRAQLLAYPALVGSVRLERRGISWGAARGLLVQARRR
jgi:SAM-dependent methyltransferase